jgi:hypothetical protein
VVGTSSSGDEPAIKTSAGGTWPTPWLSGLRGGTIMLGKRFEGVDQGIGRLGGLR